MNNNFTAQGLMSLQTSADSTFKEILDALRNVMSACSSMSSTVASEDSGLSGKWSSMADTISSPIATADATITGISSALQSFVQQTLTNEQTAESSLDMVDAEIGSLGSIGSAMTNAINNGGNNSIPGQTPPNPASPIKESPITGGNPPMTQDLPDDIRSAERDIVREIRNQ